MDELDCSWPAWKFGMKREDLATKLHDQYNTIAFSIQDPDAFHHDVVEISHAACTTDEFHRLLDERKQLRLRELNDSLESASLEIISNPKLIGTQQWQLAVQLFRTRSFDSLVRYFSSYLPDDQGWQLCSVDPDCEPILDRLDEDIPVFIREPETLAMPTATSMHDKYLPPSPRSLTMCSDSSSTSCSDASSASSPARTSSPSASEADSDMMLSSQILLHHYEDDVSQPHDLDTPRTSISDISIPASEHWRTGEDHETDSVPNSMDSCGVDELHDSATPKPRSGLSSRANTAEESDGATSSSAKLASTSAPASGKYSYLQECIRDRSPGLSRSRRTSPDVGRILKPPSPDSSRARPNGRRRHGA